MTPNTRWPDYALDALDEPIPESWWESIEEMDAREESENGRG